MRCEQCQKVIPDDVAFCAYCGAKAAASGMHAPIFRFAESQDQALTLKDLAYLIDRNWETSLRHLYEGDFANWLGAMGRGVLADQTREIVKSYQDNRALGLELFVNLVSDAAGADIPPAGPALSPPKVDFGAVPRDNLAQKRLVITNKQERGYLSGRLRLPPGVYWLALSPREFAGPRTEITLTANTRDMPAGAVFRTPLMVTTPFETVETEVVLRVSTGWAALLHTTALWTFAGALGMLAGSGAALLLRDFAPGVPWALVYGVLAVAVAVVSFGSIKTRDAVAAVVLAALVGLATLIPIALGALARGFALALLNYQAENLARALDSSAVALAAMTGTGAALGFVGGLFAGLRRVGRAPMGCLMAAALLAALGAGVFALRPTFALGAYRSSQPLLGALEIPVPYLAFAPTPPMPGRAPEPTPTPTPSPTPEPTPTPAVRPVQNVTLLWDVVAVEPDARARSVGGQIDSQGRAHVAYTATTPSGGAELRYAVREGEGWAVAAVDAGDLRGAALALDAGDRPYIAYTSIGAETGQASLYLAALTVDADTGAAAWSLEPVDGPGVGGAPSLVIDRAGRPIVAYFDARTNGLRVARQGDAGWQTESVDDVGDVGYCPALALDGDGLPHVIYIDAETDALRYRRFTGEDWFAIAVPYENRAGCDTALALGEDDARYLAFNDLDAGQVTLGFYDGEAWHFTAMGAGRAEAGGQTPLSLALAGDGRAHLTHNSPTSLRYVYDAGAQWFSAVVDGPGLGSQVMLDREGGAHVVYAFGDGVWYATLRAGTVSVLPRTPTPGPGPTPTAPGFFCGDGICQDPGADCAADCLGDGWACGDAECNEEFEDLLTCPADCAISE